LDIEATQATVAGGGGGGTCVVVGTCFGAVGTACVVFLGAATVVLVVAGRTVVGATVVDATVVGGTVGAGAVVVVVTMLDDWCAAGTFGTHAATANIPPAISPIPATRMKRDMTNTGQFLSGPRRR
jgi:hypothetical protein